MNVIGLVGRHGRGSAGAGKSTVAAMLAEDHGFVEIGLADVMKRFLREIFDFSEEQLWGPSEKRNASDPRYSGLSPRVALQQLGTQWGRSMYEDVWINKVLKEADTLLIGEKYRRYSYVPERGLIDRSDPDGPEDVHGVVISDVRFPNELRRIREVGGQIWRIDRPAPGGFDEDVLHARHASEAGLDGEKFDEIISNEGTLEHLRELVKITMSRREKV